MDTFQIAVEAIEDFECLLVNGFDTSVDGIFETEDQLSEELQGLPGTLLGLGRLVWANEERHEWLESIYPKLAEVVKSGRV
jgi:hypothetical protein